MGYTVILNDVKKTYVFGDNSINVLQGINFSVQNGEFVLIKGPSGSGKSSLLNIIGTIDTPTEGDVILFESMKVSLLSNYERAKIRLNKIGFVYQAFHLIPYLSAIDNIELPLRLRGIKGKERRERAIKILESVGLKNRVYHKPSQLSFGEQQRVAIGRALINNPQLILADEPTGNLDKRTSSEIIELLKEICYEKNITILIASHDNDIEKSVNRITYLKDGILIEL